MFRLLAALISLLVASQLAYTEPGIRLDISTVTYGAPRNTIVRYGGLVGAALDEVENQIRDQASQLIKLRYDAGIYSFGDANRAYAVVNGGNAWQPLTWYERLPERKGGLPVGTVLTIGPTNDFINTGFFKLDNKFGFKLKDHTIDGFDDPLLRNWSVRFRPSASFSTKTLVNNIGLGVFFDYRKKRVKRLEVGFLIRYQVADRSLEGTVVVEILWPK